MESLMSNRDPLESLLDYVGTVKPYHTKIYEVTLVYAYNEPIFAKVGERYEISVLMTTPEADKWFVSEGVGWDTGPYDIDQNNPVGDQGVSWGQWDYPLISGASSPSRIQTSVLEQLRMMVEMEHGDSALTYVGQNNMGWDEYTWDEESWDDPNYPGLYIDGEKVTTDGAGTSITESLTIQLV
jgi:hypothetical protein